MYKRTLLRLLARVHIVLQKQLLLQHPRLAQLAHQLLVSMPGRSLTPCWFLRPALLAAAAAALLCPAAVAHLAAAVVVAVSLLLLLLLLAAGPAAAAAPASDAGVLGAFSA